jgi:GT2 family glycosyltransferase
VSEAPAGARSSGRADLAIIIISTSEAHWLPPCLTTVFAHAGGARLDVVVVDNESTDGTRDLVEHEFPRARVVTCPNRGFGHANNRGLETCDARYALFLNPDTEVVDGTFGELVATLDRRPRVGLVGVRQITADGELFPTIRRAPNALRAWGEALGSERLRVRAPWLGERELDMERYERECACGWTSGSFMLARREALLSAGFMDERFFIYAEEADLCLRMRRAGWEIWHLPSMTIIHHADKAGIKPRLEAQGAYARRQFARKHFAPPHRAAFLAGVAARHAIRAAVRRPGNEIDRERSAAARLALRTLLGHASPPFGAPPPTAIERSNGGAPAKVGR